MCIVLYAERLFHKTGEDNLRRPGPNAYIIYFGPRLPCSRNSLPSTTDCDLKDKNQAVVAPQQEMMHRFYSLKFFDDIFKFIAPPVVAQINSYLDLQGKAPLFDKTLSNFSHSPGWVVQAVSVSTIMSNFKASRTLFLRVEVGKDRQSHWIKLGQCSKSWESSSNWAAGFSPGLVDPFLFRDLIVHESLQIHIEVTRRTLDV